MQKEVGKAISFCKNYCTQTQTGLWASKPMGAGGSFDFDSNTGAVCVSPPLAKI